MRVYLVAQIPVEHPHNFAWVILLLLAFTEKSVAKKPLRKANAASQATTVKFIRIADILLPQDRPGWHVGTFPDPW